MFTECENSENIKYKLYQKKYTEYQSLNKKNLKLNLIIISSWLQLRNVTPFLNKYQIFVKSMVEIGLVVLYRKNLTMFIVVTPTDIFHFGKFEFDQLQNKGGGPSGHLPNSA